MKKRPVKDPVYSGIIMETNDCPQCGQRFSVQSSFMEAVVHKGHSFYCPNGHELIEPKPYNERKAREAAEEAAREAERSKARQAALEKTLSYRLWRWFTI